jgi:hypothetical protein
MQSNQIGALLALFIVIAGFGCIAWYSNKHPSKDKDEHHAQ